MEIVPQLIINSLITGSIYALAGSGLALTYGILRILNFAHGPLMMLGAYFFYFLSSDLSLSIYLTVFGSLLFAILVSILTLNIFVLPFLSLSSFLPLVTTLALSIILESLVSIFFGVNVKSFAPTEIANSLEYFGVFITGLQILIIVSAFVLLAIVAAIIHLTPLGRMIRALAENRFSAQSIGISERKIVYLVFSLGTFLAMYAGVLVGYETNLQPTMGANYTIKAFAAMILGGLGSIWGAVLASFILGFIENFSIGLDFWGYSLPAGYRDAFAYLFILLVLLFKPEGLFTKRKRVA